MKRAEYDLWEAPQPTVGSANSSATEEETQTDFVGRLLVPDPETRRGWREFYVKRKPKPNGRQIGFRR